MNALTDLTIEQVTDLDELVELLTSVERTINSLQAAREGLLALGARWALEAAEQAGHEDYGDLALRSVAAELGAALRVSDRTVQRRMAEAEWKVSRFPAVWAAQGEGRIGPGHARVIVDAGEHLDDPQLREAYSQRVLAFAEHESPNRVAPIARRVADALQPRSMDERHQDAREQRRVWVKDAPDGMAELGLLGPATLVHGVFDRLTQMAAAVKDADASGSVVSSEGPDPRTTDQLRTDLALDLLLGGAPVGHDTLDGALGAITAHVQVTVPVLTLLGVEGTAPELDGRTPIDLDTARRLAGAASGWDRVLTDPITGGVIAVDRYRPAESLRRQLRGRDERCRFITCGHLARDCDLDHTHDAALGGETHVENLAHLCRRHHTLKHHSAWHVEQLGGGLLEWTSPTGRTYIDRPPPQHTVTFTDDTSAPF